MILIPRKTEWLAILAIIFLLMLPCTVPRVRGSNGSPTTTIQEGIEIEDVPYTWQEFDGFCAYASFSSVLQYYGENISLEDTLAISGASWGAIYAKKGNSRFFLTGLLSTQLRDFDYLADSLGYNLKYHYSRGQLPLSEKRRLRKEVNCLDIRGQNLDNWSDARSFLLAELKRKNPIILSLGTHYLPHRQYLNSIRGTPQIRRHVVVAVGYSDNGVKIMDPGIGALGENYFRPEKTQATYMIKFPRLQYAWDFTAFSAFSLENVRKRENITRSIGSRIVHKLSPPENSFGVYPKAYSNQSLGYMAFSSMGEDFTPGEFLSFLQSKKEATYIKNNMLADFLQSKKSSLIRDITLTKFSISKGLEELEILSKNYEEAVEELHMAIGELNNISDDYTILNPYEDVRSDNNALDLAFDAIASKLRENNSLPSAVNSASVYLDNLSRIFKNISTYLKRSSELLSGEVKVNDLKLRENTVLVGENVGISVLLHNSGIIQNSTEIMVRVEEKIVENRNVYLDPREEKSIEFKVSKSKPGSYTISVGQHEREIIFEERNGSSHYLLLIGIIATLSIIVFSLYRMKRK